MSNKINAEDFEITKSDKKNFKKSIIKRNNLSNEFTLQEMEEDLSKLATLEREMTAQIGVSHAVLGNIERHHKLISKLSDEQLQTAAYFYETKRVLDQAKSKLKEIKAQKKKYGEVKQAVYAKFGFSDEASE